jgi:hypothetical protein
MAAFPARTLHRLAAAVAVLACALAHAQGELDLMKTPECAAARRQLDPLLAAGGPHDRLVAAKRRTALACFGVALPEPVRASASASAAASASAPKPANRVQPAPVAAEPIRLRPTPSLAPSLAPPGTPPPPAPAPVITACDAAGCWDSNGAHYSQQGPLLLGPRGPCTREAGLLSCP